MTRSVPNQTRHHVSSHPNAISECNNGARCIRALAQNSGAQKPVESARPPISTPQLPSWLPPQMTAWPESTAPALNSASSTTSKKSPALDKSKAVGPQPTTVPSATKAPKSDRQIYVAKYSACHSSDGSGTGTIGRSMRIPRLTSPEVQGKSDESLASVISNGAGKMPAYKKKFSLEQIQLLVAYIRELGKKQ